MRKIDISMTILILLAVVLGIVIAHAQSLSQQQQGAQDKISADLSQISEIQQDEGTLNSQYQSALADKAGQIADLQREIYLLESWLNPPSNSTTNSTDNSTANLDTQGTVAPING